MSLVGDDEVVYSKEIPHEKKIRFAKDETTGKLYFVIDGVSYDIAVLVNKSIPVPSTGYGEVDLGLSVKWADRNVGAENPWDNGAYFSWGNVEGVVYGTTKISEDALIEQLIIMILSAELGVEATPEQIEEVKNNPEMMNEISAVIPMVISGDLILISGTTFDENTYSTTFGSQYTGSTLDAEHDAATVNMGEDWRMPTMSETVELVENTYHYYIGEDGNIVAGPFDYETDESDKGLDGSQLRSICFVKKGDDFNYNNRTNFIEFPFAGYCSGSSLEDDGLLGIVWSSTVYVGHIDGARVLYLRSDGYLDGGGSNLDYRFNGLSVRGVRA